ncbi:MAG TPA: hypothetical protein PKK00_13800 [Bacteroidales bacterium]|nr:hypothetical protein [Bacteroidales bacterium]HPS18275.1 hypothetical protein [Bacteroidales bacterium]
MSIKKIISFFLLIIGINLFATGENFPVGGRSAGMANASVTLNDFWSIYNNQSGLCGIKKISAGIYYENRFGLKNFGLKAGAVVMPIKAGVLGLSMNYFGYSMYNESKIGFAYAKKFSENFSMGIQLDYLSTHIAENYGNRSTVAGEIGLRYQLNKNLCIAGHIYNPARAKIAEYNDERILTVVKVGLSYLCSEKVLLNTETEKDIQYKAVFKAGVEYHPVKEIYFRTGIATNPFLNAFGFGIEIKNFKLDFATSYHQTLGFSPQFSMIFNVSKTTASSN